MTRLQRIAEAMGLTPDATGLLVSPNLQKGFWELHGCVGGPRPLPSTRIGQSSKEAIAAVEEFLKEELAQRDRERADV